MLKAAIAYKHDNILSEDILKQLEMRVLPLDDSSSLNFFIIDAYSYASADVQFSTMADFLIAVVEEMTKRFSESSYWWNVAETRSLIDLSILHVFNRIVNLLDSEGFIHAERYAKGVITEARLAKSKEAVIFRLEGS